MNLEPVVKGGYQELDVSMWKKPIIKGIWGTAIPPLYVPAKLTRKAKAKKEYKHICKIIEKAFKEARGMNYGDCINKHICLNCGKKMIPVKDEIANKVTGHLWRCKCLPKVIISIG